MRKTRFMSLLFLIWALAFFAIPSFRQSLSTPFDLNAAMKRGSGAFLPDELANLAAAAETKRDAKTLAIAAMHFPGPQRSEYAEKAIAIDPKYTWIYLSMANRSDAGPNVTAWLAKLKAWAPDNAVIQLRCAQDIFERHKLGSYGPLKLEELSKDTEWMAAMDAAFSATKYDSYHIQRFQLEADWMREHDRVRPASLVLSAISYPIPNLLMTRSYVNVQVNKLGKEEEEAKKPAAALQRYWKVVHMAQRMNAEAKFAFERAVATSLLKVVNDRMAPLLRAQGQNDAADSLESSRVAMLNATAVLWRNRFSQSAVYGWNALIITLLTMMAAVFAFLTIICVAYVNLKRFWRRDKRGKIFAVMTTAENYMPILLFLACLGIYLVQYPYAMNLQYYVTSDAPILDFENILLNVLPFIGLIEVSSVPFSNPFVPYVWYALGGLAVVVLLHYVLKAVRPAAAGSSQ